MQPAAQKRLAVSFAVLLPPLCFYLLLFRSLTSLPFLDDYASVLGFMLTWKQEHSLGHLVQIITAQHYEYKLMFENAIFGAQYELFGHADLLALSVLGDLFVLPISWALYLVWKENESQPLRHLAAFAPASALLFQLQYAASLNSAMASLQILPVILFALLSCYLGTRLQWWCFVGAIGCMVLSIASSGNGFFLLPILGIFFLQKKNYKYLGIWLACGLIILAVYFHGYNFHNSQAHADGNVLSSGAHFSIPYTAAFLGAIAAKINPIPAVLFGAALIVIFGMATWDKTFQRKPGLYYSTLFFITTAVFVSALRSDLGLETAVISRYRINSTIFVILIYFYVSGKYRERLWTFPTRVGIIATMTLVLVCFDTLSNRAGQQFLLVKRQKLEAGMVRWLRHESRPSFSASNSGDYMAANDRRGIYDPIEPLISQAVRSGVFSIPKLH